MTERDPSAESRDTTGRIPAPNRRAAQPDATAPDGSEIRLLADGRHAATKSSLVEVTLPAGQISRPVYHRTVEEIWYILDGEGHVWRCPPAMVSLSNNADPASVPPQPVSPGDALVIPTGWCFQFAASPNGPLRFLCHTTPPWPGQDEALTAERGGLGDPTV